MADVKREQELAERRKNDPVLDVAQDHLVRKIFSKFRKPSDSGVPQSRPGSSLTHGPVSHDIEKGEMPQTQQTTHEPEKPRPVVGSQPESRTSTGGSRGSKWASALANATHNNAAPPQQTITDLPKQRPTEVIRQSDLFDNEVIDKQTSDRDDQNMGAVRRTELVCKKSEHIHVVKDIRPPTQGNKWPRVATGGREGDRRPETIEESAEPEGGDGKRIVPQISVDGEPTSRGGGGGSDVSRVVIQPKSINSADYQQIIASLIDMRIDLKLEIQKLSHKVTKIDEHISDIVKKLSAFNIRTDDNSHTSGSVTSDTKQTKPVSVISNKNNDFFDESDENRLLEESSAHKGKADRTDRTETTKRDSKESRSADKSGGGVHRGVTRAAAAAAPQPVPIRTINTSSGSNRKTSDKISKQVSDASNTETDEMRAMLENEIAEQDVDNTDDDQDLTSKL